MHEGAIMVSVHSLTQDSRNALNRSRTGKNPIFYFIRPDFWTDLNGCRQRLLFARHVIPRKCSLCSQGTCMPGQLKEDVVRPKFKKKSLDFEEY